MKIRRIGSMRLYRVAETPNDEGCYDLTSFDGNAVEFNDVFEPEDLNAELDALVECLYGRGFWVEVDESNVETRRELLRLEIAGSCIEVPDVLAKLNCDPDNSLFFLLTDQVLEDGTWVVAEKCDS